LVATSKIMKKLLKTFGKIIVAVLLAAVAYFATDYLRCTQYDFAEPQPFTGEALYNPYDGADFGQAKKAIFHFHTDRSDGKDTPEEMVEAYRTAGYDIVSPADHDRVTPAGITPECELGTYEHGLNGYKFHNLAFGAEIPLRFQLPLWQNTSARENILRRLSEQFPIVVLNHPGSTRGLTNLQMERLSHYDYIEADGGMTREFTPWDAALSAGHYSFVMAGDDLHDLKRTSRFGRAMTFVMTSDVDATCVMHALEKGHSYAARVAKPTLQDKIPHVTDFNIAGDTLRVAFDTPAREVLFTGQGGVLRKTATDATETSCVFGPDDTYIRVEARFETGGGTTLYLNPVARYRPADGNRPVNASYSRTDSLTTTLFAAGHALLIALCVALIFLLFRKKGKYRETKNAD
jgi:hypothetical protein